MRRLIGLCAFVVAAGVSFSSYRERARTEQRADVAAAHKQLAATPLAPNGTAPHAGISARVPIDVRAFPEKLAKSLHGDTDFHHLVHRCGVCHSTPDPSLHTAAEWDQVLDRMAFNIQSAGLLPLADEQRAAILNILRHYATPSLPN
jgi:hypothetical protein